MRNGMFLYTIVCLLFTIVRGFGQEVRIPNFKDRYSEYVKKLEVGQTEIDYEDFRNSFIESKQFWLKGTAYDSLEKEIYPKIVNREYKEVVRLTKEMLSLDYTSIFAHKYLQQTYKFLGDTINWYKYRDIELGLLRSITRSGDGKSCETGWHVVQIEEEYFLLNMLGAEFQSQAIVSKGKNTCDKMEVTTEEGQLAEYYFEANKVFEMERKMFGKK